MAEKMTKKQWYEVLANIVKKSKNPQKAGALEFIAHEIELLDKKSGKSKTSKTAKTNDKIKYAILDVLAENEKPMTVSEMMLDSRLATWKDGDAEKVMSNQKLSSMIRQLVNEELVIRTEDKKKALFSLPTDEVEEDETLQTEEEEEVEKVTVVEQLKDYKAVEIKKELPLEDDEIFSIMTADNSEGVKKYEIASDSNAEQAEDKTTDEQVLNSLESVYDEISELAQTA